MGRELWNKLDIFLYIDEAARNQHTAATCSPGGFARYDIFVATEQGQFTRNSGIQKQNPVVAATRCSKNQNIKGKHGTKGKLTPHFKPPRSAFRADKDMRINEFYHLTRACSNLIPRPLDILRPVYTCDFWCDFWCDFACKTRLTLPYTNAFFAKHRVDWKESYHILFEDTLHFNFC